MVVKCAKSLRLPARGICPLRKKLPAQLIVKKLIDEEILAEDSTDNQHCGQPARARAAGAAERERAVPDEVARIAEKTYQSSRWSSRNLFFPDRLTLAGDGMLFHKGAMFGSSGEHINYQAVASVRIKNGIFLSNVSIETSGGSQPIFMNGLWKSEAREIQDTIRAFQKEANQALIFDVRPTAEAR